MQRRMGTHSETRAMADICESFEEQLEGYVGQFTRAENQRGMLVAINSRVAGLEIFDSGDNFAK